jgi:hypothetical protein
VTESLPPDTTIIRKSDCYECAVCKKIFDYWDSAEWSQEDAIEEFLSKFPGTDPSDALIVCDDCVKKVDLFIDLSPANDTGTLQ